MYHLSILLTILLTVYGQLIFKWCARLAGEMPDTITLKAYYLIKFLFNPWIISAYLAAVLASVFWFLALTKFDLSYAYPFMSLSFVFVLILSGVFFNESITLHKVAGVLLILIGIAIGSRS